MTEPAKPEVERLISDEVVAKQRNRQVMVLTVIILVLAGLVWLTRATGTEQPKLDPVPLVGGSKDALAFKKEDVTQIEIWAGKDKPLILTQDQGGWRVPARFGAPADRNDVDALLTKLFDSKRLGRASTEDTQKYGQYNLADEDAVHLRLQSAAGKELLHLLVGRSDDGARDFVRLLGDHPQGIFELAGPGGAWDTLYSRLQLDVDGKAEPKRWLDLTSFKVIESGTRVDKVIVQDGDRTFEFRHDPVNEDKWEVTRPRQGDGEATAIKGVVSVLENLAASDIAGRDTDAGALGIADSKRAVTLEYLRDTRPVTATVTFGQRKDGLVAVQLKTANQGALIHWVADYVLDRVFRKPGEFIRRADLGLVPVGIDIDRIRGADGDKLLHADKVAAGPVKEWRLTKPAEAKADRLAVSTLLTTLNTLRGLKHLEAADFVALGVDPSVSKKWLEIGWAEKGEKKEGEEAPPEIRKLGALYFGKIEQGEVAVLVRVTGRDDAVFWLDEAVLQELFSDFDSYVDFEVTVRHVLITWRGKNDRALPKDPNRTKEQADAIVAEVLQKARAGEDFVALQKAYSDEQNPDFDNYTIVVTPREQLVPEFIKLAGKLKLDEVDICESMFGIHVMKRIK